MIESIKIRSAVADDYHFILDSWLFSYFDASDFTKEIPKTLYWKFHQRAIKGILSRAQILIACMQDDESVIYGYGVFEKAEVDDYLAPKESFSVVHYLYVKRAFGRLGIATKLFEEAALGEEVFATHLTHSGKHIQRKYAITYLPYLI